jgi:hypothetical protein
MISTRTLAASAVVIAMASGCAAGHGHDGVRAAAGDPAGLATETAAATTTPTSSTPATPGVPNSSPSPAATVSEHAPRPSSPQPSPDPSPTVGVRPSADDVCTKGYIYFWGYVTDAQNDVATVVLHTRFVPSNRGQELDGQLSMTKDSAHADQYDATVNGSSFLGQTGTLHYAVTATDNAGHTTTTAGYSVPVVTC